MFSNDLRYTKVCPHSDSRGDFVKEKARQEPVKAIARKTGLTEAAVVKFRTGSGQISYGALRKWLASDEEFREGFIAELRSDPWTAAGAIRPQSFAPPSYGDPNVDKPLPGSVGETEALMRTFGDRS